uniref:Retrotransposon gag domain-containing protein n=1 Tax=Leptobrachium leishanense TaxID=445787 RepID=A0A8C5QHS7_9ANUR
MDLAGTAQQLSGLESRLEDQDHRLDQFAQALQTLLNRTAPTQVEVLPPVNPPPSEPFSVPTSYPNLLPPVRYGGDPNACRGFLNQISIHFELTPWSYPTDRAKIAFVINHLTDKALRWANPLWETDKPIVYNYREFMSAFRRVFDPTGPKTNAAKSLLRLRQGTKSLGDYALEFRSLASELNWNNEALVAVFSEGLNDELQDEVAARDLPEELEDLITYLSYIDERLRHRRNTKERSMKPLVRPLLVQAIDGRPPETPFVLFETQNISVGIGLCHKESMFFHAITSPSYPIVLGYPWLTRHNPVIDWRARQIARWDNDCMASC